jgi:aspartate-semialdehyde dehydrogenase
VEIEPLKILGTLSGGRIGDADFRISAMVHMVATTDGQLESAYLETEERFVPKEVEKALREFKGEPQKL